MCASIGVSIYPSPSVTSSLTRTVVRVSPYPAVTFKDRTYLTIGNVHLCIRFTFIISHGGHCSTFSCVEDMCLFIVCAWKGDHEVHIVRLVERRGALLMYR